jgi:cytochrome d ubiquinol oxidase subunit II
MATLWFALLCMMLIVYVVLDGFDFGAGILHIWVARSDEERRTIIAAIGPVWDGNEVWLIAAGGVLVCAFSRVYAAGFSGFYLPLVMALWLLILRGLSIEMRSHEKNFLWRSFWDGLLFFSSALMAVVLGAALGCIIRGVPLNQTGFFEGPLFTDFRVSAHPGVLDWYTVLVGLFALCTLALHGALYLYWKTAGPVQQRCRAIAPYLWGIQVMLGVVTTYATNAVRPDLYVHLVARPWTWIFAITILLGVVGIPLQLRRGSELPAFLASCAVIVGLLGATAAGLYPTVLHSTISPAYDLTIYNAANGESTLRIALFWWIPAFLLAILYFATIYRLFRGKAELDPTGQSHYG